MNKYDGSLAPSQFVNAVIVAVLMIVAGCTHTPVVQEFSASANVTGEIEKFQSDLATAEQSRVEMLSPKNFASAKDELSDAKRLQASDRGPSDALHHVALGKAYLKQAEGYAQLAHTNIDAVIIAREQALQAGAPKILDREFREADERLLNITRQIEKDSLQAANENRAGLQTTYLDLELRSIKEGYLRAPRDLINQARSEGAPSYAPKTLVGAEKSLRDTDAYITGNRHETAQIEQRALGTRQSAEHLIKITRDSKAGKVTSSEDSALKLEGEQARVLDKQHQINDRDSQLSSQRGQAIKNENTIQALSSENSKLEQDQKLSMRFNEARAEFKDTEAEVYQQGNNLMIRLRGLEFSVAQAALKAENFPLLAKVQRVIRGFGPSSITIEGHTDSVGGRPLNARLSTNRAEAVREYLLANAEGQPLTIKAVGLDYQKPLATNKTASGRAQNRRVDVLIQAE